jgi:SRSO17 transposase
MQHFISQSPWEHLPVQDQIAKDADRLLGGSPDTGFFFDETSNPKKGEKSVGVARQWCGRLGKVENCQTAVFGALSMGPHVTLIDERLYLPKVWTDDKKRCEKAGVPDDIEFKTKSQLALEMIGEAREKRIRFTWVGVDGGYGKEPDFLSALDNANEIFMADVHKDQTIYLEDPAPYLPEKKRKGRAPTRLVAAATSMRVDKWVASQTEESWQRIAFRESTKGRLQADFLTQRVWTWNESEAMGRLRHLIVRREIGSKEEIKYSLSNAPEGTGIDRLAFMQGQRYFVERAFQDAKSNVGLDHYQVRGWQAWHNHMTMVMLAMLYMLETRMAKKSSHPLLSCADIVELLSHFLPRKDVTEEEVLRQMENRHRQRQAAIDFAYAKQRSG